MKVKLRKILELYLAVAILCGIIVMATLTVTYVMQNVVYIQGLPEDPLEAWSESSYVVWQYNSTFYACRNMSTLLIEYFGTNDDYAIQWGIDNATDAYGGSIYVKAPSYTGTYNAAITLKNQTTLILEAGAAGISVTIDTGATATLLDYHNYDFKVWDSGVLTGFTEYRSSIETASYTISREGSFYFAKNGTTGAINFFGTNASEVVNNAMLNFPLDSNGHAKGKIVFARGEFYFDTPIDVDMNNTVLGSGIVIEGQGRGTLLGNIGSNTVIYAEGLTGDSVVIRDLDISGYATGNRSIPLIWLRGTGNSLVENVFLHSGNCTGIKFEGTIASTLRNSEISFFTMPGGDKVGVGVEITSWVGAHPTYTLDIYGNHIVENYWNIYFPLNPAGWSFDIWVHHNEIGGSGNASIYAEGATHGLMIENNYFEETTDDRPSIELLSLNQLSTGARIHKNSFTLNDYLDIIIGSNGTAKVIWYTEIIGNFFYGGAGAMSISNASTQARIQNNDGFNQVYHNGGWTYAQNNLGWRTEAYGSTVGTSPIAVYLNPPFAYAPNIVLLTPEGSNTTDYGYTWTANTTYLLIYHGAGASVDISWYAYYKFPTP